MAEKAIFDLNYAFTELDLAPAVRYTPKISDVVFQTEVVFGSKKFVLTVFNDIVYSPLQTSQQEQLPAGSYFNLPWDVPRTLPVANYSCIPKISGPIKLSLKQWLDRHLARP